MCAGLPFTGRLQYDSNCIGPDTPRASDEPPLPKVFLRTLLFLTSKRGRVIECMYVALSRNETRQNFNIWVYGAEKKLVRGSGLFVGETGVEANHHFRVLFDVAPDSLQCGHGTWWVEVTGEL
jgi:hypothetical protein